MPNNAKPITHQADLAKLPRALAPLIERPQWCVWRWTQKPDGTWQKPPFQAMQPDAHGNVKDPSTWTDYDAALDAVQTGRADGVTYMLTADDPFAAIDLDHCRDVGTHSIDIWAQNFLDVGRYNYAEVTPSGSGLRLWGLSSAGAIVHRHFTLTIDGKKIDAELFRHTNKALTITGLTLDPAIRELANIDKTIDWGVIWGERRKAAEAEAAPAKGSGSAVNGNGCGYDVGQIEVFVREGAPVGENRSDLFHTIVGHYVGCGWNVEQIYDHMRQFPAGIGNKYLDEGRLSSEIRRSADKFAMVPAPGAGNGWTVGWEAKAPQPEPDDPELDDPELVEPDDELEFEDDPPELDDDELLDEPKQTSDLPPLYAHGDPDPRPIKGWLLKNLMATAGHGLLSGQWGTGKTFVVLELSAALMTGQPFLDYQVKRQCGVLFIAAEGADEVRRRLDAMVREKCGGMARAPFRWYETAPVLLQKDAVEKLTAMTQQAEASLQAEFGLPLGLIIIDTLTACAGYATQGAENDIGIGQALMNKMKAVAAAANCFVLGVGHLGKDIERGTRGATSKEDSSDLALYCLGEKELSGAVTDTRLAVRKNRGGKQGQQYPFVLREVTAPEPDEDGDPITTMVVDWRPAGPEAPDQSEPDDPWVRCCRRQDQRTPMLRLKRVLEAVLAENGVELSIPPDGPVVRMADQKLVRTTFYACTPADEGTPKQKQDRQRAQFDTALNRAEEARLIGIRAIEDVTYLWLTRPDSENSEDPGSES